MTDPLDLARPRPASLHTPHPRRSSPAPTARRQPRTRLRTGGTDGNERLTALTGIVLILLLAPLGVTILRIGQLLWVHLFIGLLLIGPVALKLASTGYRFVRYYMHEPHYRRKGPPAPALRLLGPLVVLSTVVVFASGVALLLLGPNSRSSLLLIHKASFILWLAVTAVHVLGHLPEIQRAFTTARDTRRVIFANAERGFSAGDPTALPGRSGRTLSLTGALVAGLALALASIPQYGPWLHSYRFH